MPQGYAMIAVIFEVSLAAKQQLRHRNRRQAAPLLQQIDGFISPTLCLLSEPEKCCHRSGAIAALAMATAGGTPYGASRRAAACLPTPPAGGGGGA
jgi:hypothetical protein